MTKSALKASDAPHPDREIVLDTETTGFDPFSGHKIVEIGCVEVVNYMPTGRTYHVYIDPERDMPKGAFSVHGLSQKFLSQFSTFKTIAQSFLDFVGVAPLVIHNASFDMKFLQAELASCGMPALENPVVDTLQMARKKFPGASVSLDMLCRRFSVDNQKRDKHGALLDAQLLGQVYLELKGGRQIELLKMDVCRQEENSTKQRQKVSSVHDQKAGSFVKERSFSLTDEEKNAHSALMTSLGKKKVI